jgi:hypothetical protein
MSGACANSPRVAAGAEVAKVMFQIQLNEGRERSRDDRHKERRKLTERLPRPPPDREEPDPAHQGPRTGDGPPTCSARSGREVVGSYSWRSRVDTWVLRIRLTPPTPRGSRSGCRGRTFPGHFGNSRGVSPTRRHAVDTWLPRADRMGSGARAVAERRLGSCRDGSCGGAGDAVTTRPSRPAPCFIGRARLSRTGSGPRTW